jgi:hypothetical protein
MLRSFFLVSGCLLALAPANAAKRIWDAERYDKCLTVSGADELDSDHIVNSSACRTSHGDVESQSVASSHNVTVMASAAGARNKDKPELAYVAIIVGVRVERIDTYLGGAAMTRDGRGRIGLSNGTVLVNEQRVSIEPQITNRSGPECSYMSRGAVSGRTCAYSEVAQYALPVEALTNVATRYAVDKEGVFRLRIAADSAASLTLALPLAEIEAVRRRIFPGS